jgi:hypothetical protein
VTDLVEASEPDERRAVILLAEIERTANDFRAAQAACSSHPEFGVDPQRLVDLACHLLDVAKAWQLVVGRLVRADRVEWTRRLESVGD